jgi:Zn-dependent M28 family amino/carboxypeptidase
MLRAPYLIVSVIAVALLAMTGCIRSNTDSVIRQVRPAIDKELLLEHVRILASDDFQGRRTGSDGGAMAADYVRNQMALIGLMAACSEDLTWPFTFESRRDQQQLTGSNVIGLIAGSAESTRVIVVSAHFDHLGMRGEEIFNGADDNASGTAAMLEISRYFSENPPRHSIIFAGFDAEEMGLRGASAFVESPCFSQFDISLEINMDMISRSDRSELYASGPLHYPALRTVIEDVSRPEDLSLLFGHDEPGSGSDDWTFASDHGPFHQVGIPFVYFGVEDHPGYHNPSDDFEDITPAFFHHAAEFVLNTVEAFDATLDSVLDSSLDDLPGAHE